MQITVDGKQLALSKTPIRSSNANGLTDAIRYQIYAPLNDNSVVKATSNNSNVKFEVSPVVAGRATVKCTFNGKEKIYLIN